MMTYIALLDHQRLSLSGRPILRTHNRRHKHTEMFVIPGATVYFWFLYGMITFSYMVDRPFTDLSGEPCRQPLINPHKAIVEMNRAIAQRFPSGRAMAPDSIFPPFATNVMSV